MTDAHAAVGKNALFFINPANVFPLNITITFYTKEVTTLCNLMLIIGRSPWIQPKSRHFRLSPLSSRPVEEISYQDRLYFPQYLPRKLDAYNKYSIFFPTFISRGLRPYLLCFDIFLPFLTIIKITFLATAIDIFAALRVKQGKGLNLWHEITCCDFPLLIFTTR